VKKPRYFSGALLLWRGCNTKEQNGRIDMGHGTGISQGIYDNVFKDRPRILNAKRAGVHHGNKSPTSNNQRNRLCRASTQSIGRRVKKTGASL